MDFILELLQLDEAKNKKDTTVSPKTAHDVYHRDYLRTRKKPYRKYNKAKHAVSKEAQ
jgi:hypothetical protein